VPSLQKILDEIREDLKAIRDHTDDLKSWEERHEERHTADQEVLASIVGALSKADQKLIVHESNGDHTPSSAIVRSGSFVAVLAGAIVIAAEIIRSFAF